MKRTKPLSLICVLLVLAILLAVGLCYTLILDNLQVAKATEVPTFTIKALSRTEWELYKEDNLILSCEGEFFYVSNPASVAILNKIKQELVADGIITQDYADNNVCHDRYVLNFDFSSDFIAQSTGGTTTIQYTTQNDSPILISASRAPFINAVGATSLEKYLEYKGKNDTQYTQHVQSLEGEALRFGQNVNVGEYDVRVVLRERFEFDGKARDAYHYSTTITCKIEKAPYTNTQNARAEIVYGDRIKDIEVIDEVSNYLGRWELSQQQTLFDDNVGVEEMLLGVGSYYINFDFYPDSQNYLPALNVPVPVKVERKTLTIYIGDVHAIAGEEVVDVSKVPIGVKGLVGDDTIEDLNITLSYPKGFDGKTAGTYDISVQSMVNPNYNYMSYGMSNPFTPYGRYIVYSNSIIVEADDGKQFELYCVEGFIGIHVSITRIDVDVAGLIVVSAYKISLVAVGDSMLPPSEYVISWSEDVLGAQYVFKEGGEMYSTATTDRMVMGDGDDTIIFAKDAHSPIIAPDSSLNDGAIAAIVIGTILAVMSAISIVLLSIRLSFILKIDKLRKYDAFTYVREEAKKQEANSLSQKKDDKPKKQRHGKKNKQNRSANEE